MNFNVRNELKVQISYISYRFLWNFILLIYFYEFFWQRNCIQRKILLRKSYFEFFFQPMDVSTYKRRRKIKNPKKVNYLKWEITGENLKNHIKIAHLYRFFSIAVQKLCFELYFKLVQEAYLFNLFLLKIVKERRVTYWTDFRVTRLKDFGFSELQGLRF